MSLYRYLYIIKIIQSLYYNFIDKKYRSILFPYRLLIIAEKSY